MLIVLYVLSWLTRLLVLLLKVVGRQGTALPGLWVERYAPGIIGHYARRYTTIVVITGTNGKTTTQHLVASVLGSRGTTQIVRNSSGSNMLRGIAATLLLRGPVGKGTVFVCETEEATMPRVTQHLQPHYIIITNLFRDQLDAYGELHTTARYITRALTQSPRSVVIANGDDPALTQIYRSTGHTTYLYGLSPGYTSQIAYEGQAVSQHLHMSGRDIAVDTDLTTKVTIDDWVGGVGSEYTLALSLPGLYNVYNLLATVTLARLMSMTVTQIEKALITVTPPFGRGERVIVSVKDHPQTRLTIFLVKNPAGFDQIWRLVAELKDKKLLLCLNDKIADGRDVSWIWDIPLTSSGTGSISHLVISGTRAYDLALRLKYALIEPTYSTQVVTSIDDAIDSALSLGGDVYVMATYTAMNELRKSIGRYTRMDTFGQ